MTNRATFTVTFDGQVTPGDLPNVLKEIAENVVGVMSIEAKLSTGETASLSADECNELLRKKHGN